MTRLSAADVALSRALARLTGEEPPTLRSPRLSAAIAVPERETAELVHVGYALDCARKSPDFRGYLATLDSCLALA